MVVATVVVLAYAFWLSLQLRTGTDPQDFIHIGRQFATRSQASAAITAGVPTYRYDDDIGFDGQTFFYIAVDPVHAREYLDYPAYRYTRIVYPLTAGALGLFDRRLVPWTLILVNLGMIGVGVLALAAWLRDRGASSWLAAIYGFYPGTLVTLQRDTSEIMSYGLVAVAVYLHASRLRGRLLLTGAAFGLAVLTRETAAVFALLYAIGQLASGTGSWRERVAANWRSAGVLLLLSFAPIALLKLLLLVWLGSLGLVDLFGLVPFRGILYFWPWQPGVVEEVRTLVVPAVICGAAAVWALARDRTRIEVWALLVNVVALVVLLGPGSWVDMSSSGRITIGVALAAVMCAALLARRSWFWASSALWLTWMVIWVALPAAAYVLAGVRHRLPL